MLVLQDPQEACRRRLMSWILRTTAGHDKLNHGGTTLQVVCYTQPLVPSLWKTLLKLLNNSMFAAKPALISVVARCEGDAWQPRGLVQGGSVAVQPYLSALIGQASAHKSHG